MALYKVVKTETYYVYADNSDEAQNIVSDTDNSSASSVRMEVSVASVANE